MTKEIVILCELSIDVFRCIDACGLAPILTVNDKVYGKLTKSKEYS